MRHAALAILTIVLAATSLSAAVSQKYVEFAAGPEQFLMTKEEQRQWKRIAADDAAQEFIDLFWARRDPTPGTPYNEFRDEFQRRVEYADRNFKEARRRGALTERGRVLVVLGFPANMKAELEKRSGQYVLGGSSSEERTGSEGGALADPTGGRALAARDSWIWERADALKFNMPKIEVVFIYDGFRGSARRDPQRPDFSSAWPNAIEYYIRNPGLKSAPEWAKRIRLTQEEKAREEAATVASLDRQSAPLPENAPPPGAGHLTLVKDMSVFQPQSGRDPFQNVSGVSNFTRADELGWGAQYCGTSEEVRVSMAIDGTSGGKKVRMSAPAEDVSPDAIKAQPGCYLVRGTIPLEEVDAGDYRLSVLIEDPATKQTYNLQQDFRLE